MPKPNPKSKPHPSGAFCDMLTLLKNISEHVFVILKKSILVEASFLYSSEAQSRA
jgi:hypothetical protein